MNVQMDNITVHTDASISYPKMENSLVHVQRDTNSEQTNDLVKMSMNVSGKYSASSCGDRAPSCAETAPSCTC